jgi:hypothetical protein
LTLQAVSSGQYLSDTTKAVFRRIPIPHLNLSVELLLARNID